MKRQEKKGGKKQLDCTGFVLSAERSQENNIIISLKTI